MKGFYLFFVQTSLFGGLKSSELSEIIVCECVRYEVGSRQAGGWALKWFWCEKMFSWRACDVNTIMGYVVDADADMLARLRLSSNLEALLACSMEAERRGRRERSEFSSNKFLASSDINITSHPLNIFTFILHLRFTSLACGV